MRLRKLTTYATLLKDLAEKFTGTSEDAAVALQLARDMILLKVEKEEENKNG